MGMATDYPTKTETIQSFRTERDALAAEAAMYREALEDTKGWGHSEWCGSAKHDCPLCIADKALARPIPEAVKAYERKMRAEGIDDFAAWLRQEYPNWGPMAVGKYSACEIEKENG